MSLLDLTNDPQRMGLLSLGLRLMQTPGKFGAALGSAGSGALGDMIATQQRVEQGQDRKRRLAMEEQQQMMTALQLQQAIQAQQAKQAEARQAAEAAQRRGSYLGAIDPNAGPAMPFNPASAFAAGLSPQEVGALTPKEPEAVKDQDVRLLEMLHGKGTPGFMAALGDLAKKRTTHAPATSAVSYGSPVPIMLPDGSIGYAQPPNKPGAQPQVMADPTTGKPMVKPSEASAKPTEDQSKAAGWLVQASNAYKNLKAAGFDKAGNPLPASQPGLPDFLEGTPVIGGLANTMRSADRQKFIQAASSMSEALLRAATGAGVNMDEAKQKVQELTPVYGEKPETTKQKMAAIPLYIESLKVRAGPAAKGLPVAESGGLGVGMPSMDAIEAELARRGGK